MTELKYQDIEGIFLILFAIGATIIEKLRGGRVPTDTARRYQSYLGFLAVLVFVKINRDLIYGGAELVGLRGTEKASSLEALALQVDFLKIFLGLVLTDFCLYWLHRLMHTVPMLWRAHRWHHSAEDLNWLSGFRTSYIHALLFALPQVLIPFFILKFNFLEICLGFSFGVFIQIFSHLNVEIRSPLMNRWFGTPTTHRVHHARDKSLHDVNFGIIFMCWDRMFGTFFAPEKAPAEFPLGLPESGDKGSVFSWKGLLGF